jgi:DUF971 family protein
MNYNDDLDAMIEATAEKGNAIKVTDKRGQSNHRPSTPVKVQSPSDVELFKKIARARDAADSAKHAHDSINSDNYESGVFDSTYKPLSAEQRESQEELFQKYKAKKKLAKDLFKSLTPSQAVLFEKYEQDLSEKGNAGIGWFVLGGMIIVTLLIMLVVGAFNINGMFLGYACMGVFFLSIFLAMRSGSKADEAFNAKWHPEA